MRLRAAATTVPTLALYDDLRAMRPRRAQMTAPDASMGEERMTLHTVQAPAAWAELVETGVLCADPAFVDPHFVGPYAWLGDQMTARGLPGDGMVWAWARIRPRDLRVYLDCHEPAVMVTLEVPRARVLLTHHGDWHCVLNNLPWVDIAPGDSDEQVERRMYVVIEAGVAAVEASWSAIFDPVRWSAESAIQATVREVRAEDVIRAVRLLPPRRLHLPSASWR